MIRGRWRTAAAVVAVPLLLALYAVAVATLAGLLPDQWLVELVFYVVTGLAWIPPVLRLIGWAARDPGGM